MTPKVSVIMAAKNYARFIAQAIESVIAQTFTEWELVIIDDGSTDDTMLKVKPFLKDPRIRYYSSDKLGQSRAKNLGFHLCQGEWIAYLDADDAWLPTKLEKQMNLFSRDAERSALGEDELRSASRLTLGVVFCGRDFLDEAGNVTPAPANASDSFRRGNVIEPIFLKNFVCFSSVMIRREVLEYVGVFEPNIDLSIDYDLWLRVARHYHFDFVDERLVLYRTGHGNLSKKLLDRVDTALSIKHRSLYRRGLEDQVPKSTIAEGHSTTLRTLAYILRPSEPLTALKLYFKSFRWAGSRFASFKGIIASLLKFLSGRRSPGVPDNASVNR